MTTSNTIATAPGALPLLGHLVSLLRDPLKFLRSLPAYGNLVRVRLGPVQAVVVCDPGLTRQVFLDDQTFDKGGPIYVRGRELVRSGLFTCPYSDHRWQRRLLQPSFHPSRLQTYTHAMAAQISDVMTTWRDGQVLDVSAELRALTARIIGVTLFSSTLPATKLQQTIEDINVLIEGIARRVLIPPALDWLPIPGNRRTNQVHTHLRQTLGAIIADRRASGIDQGDLLSIVLATQDPDPAGAHHSLSDTEICDQILSFFIAGMETTATTLAWALYLLAQHPQIEAQLHAEVDATLGGGIAMHEHLPKLKLTSRIITEALRLYPPGPLFTRAATVNTHLGGHAISAGTTVVYSPYILQHRADLYPNPERFDPDRWDSTLKAPPPRDGFIPFAGGARKCIGDQFAMTELTLALASIAARWKVCSLPDQPVRPTLRVVLYPKSLRLRVVARSLVSGSTQRSVAGNRDDAEPAQTCPFH